MCPQGHGGWWPSSAREDLIKPREVGLAGSPCLPRLERDGSWDEGLSILKLGQSWVNQDELLPYLFPSLSPSFPSPPSAWYYWRVRRGDRVKGPPFLCSIFGMGCQADQALEVDLWG